MGSGTLVNIKFLCSNFWHFIALGFGSGLSKIAPGSFGTLMTFVYFFLIHKLDFQLQCLTYILLFWLSFVSTQKTLINLNVKDPSCIVIDEIIAFLFCVDLVTIQSLFIFYRFYSFSLI
jgi:phosphatidylglycerophosphatase A